MKVRAYHGSNKLFTTFNNQESFFLTDPDAASFFGKTLYHCELSLKNPLVIDAEGQSWGGLFLEGSVFWKDLLEFCIKNSGGDPENEMDEETQYFKEYGITINFLGEWAKQNGYDGIVALNLYEDDANHTGTQIEIFDSEQISILDMKILDTKENK